MRSVEFEARAKAARLRGALPGKLRTSCLYERVMLPHAAIVLYAAGLA